MVQAYRGRTPEMLKSKDLFPSELSCEDASAADPQSIAANITAATAIVDMLYNILAHGENMVRQSEFSTKSLRMQAVLDKRRSAA